LRCDGNGGDDGGDSRPAFHECGRGTTGISDYKALVCIFLAGGNDSNNLIVPTVPSEYNSYATIRTPVLALPAGNLQTLDGYTDPAGHTFGLHPACPELKTLFSEGKLAVLFNTGTLIQPITRQQYIQNSKPSRRNCFPMRIR